jgi:MoaA/NifB/PqqE/SkfB family radical SAM enzyme
MSIHTFGRRLNRLRDRIVLNAVARWGREYVPLRPHRLNIETSSRCNLECRFCAYPKKHSPKVAMSNEMFFDCIEQAVEMGLTRYQMTPCTGDVFMDPKLLEKLEFLESHPGVEAYSFFTNLTIPSESQLERLLGLSKLTSVTISIYGHDLDSFRKITCSTEKVYRRLVRNLEQVLDRLDDARPAIDVGFRSVRRIPRGTPSELLALLKRFREAGIRVRTSHVYNNWGGYVTQDDVQGLDMVISSDDSSYKLGACALLFTGVQVMATGIVNGCACRDVDATLRIGDLNEQPLREIISSRNEAYMQLIREQQAGEFRPVCRSCDFYKSIYRPRGRDRRDHGHATLPEFLSELPGAVDRAP